MYKSTSKNSQNAATHIHISKLMNGEQNLTDVERYESFKDSRQRLLDIHANETNKELKLSLGKQIDAMNRKLSDYKDKAKASNPPLQVGEYIIQIFKEKCSKEEWDVIINEARRRALA
jgi:hypothetical protein